jgi:hypothetical protein
LTAIAKNDYERVTGNLGNRAYIGGMPANELNRDNHEFTHNEANYWIYTFTTRDGVLHYRFLRKMDEGQARAGEARTDLKCGSRCSWTIRRHLCGNVLSDVGEGHKTKRSAPTS